ncbi:branched-chain-amino-acid transaminase [bacterium]|jgi:branched-chain amino acid aminotransferase|nr:branched-chain-amino-acid transaminase [bacterium]
MSKIYMNGKLVEKADAVISVYDHGFLYGDGIFEGIRIYNSAVFKLHEHIVRLYESARHIDLNIPLTIAEMCKAVEDTVRANGKKDGYIRLVVSRGVGNLGLDPRKTTNPQIIIIVDDISIYPEEMYEKGMEIITAATIRNIPNALNPRIKSLNYLNNILAKLEANRAGVPEAIMLNHLGEVAECTADNIFLVKNGVLKTPAPQCGILEGITRNTVMDLAKAEKITVQEVVITRHDVFTADECFLTGTAAEVISVVKCDGRMIGTGVPGEVTKLLRARFRKFVGI